MDSKKVEPTWAYEVFGPRCPSGGCGMPGIVMLVPLLQPPTSGISLLVALRTPGIAWKRCSSSL
jgi:hypothetical protein